MCCWPRRCLPPATGLSADHRSARVRDSTKSMTTTTRMSRRRQSRPERTCAAHQPRRRHCLPACRARRRLSHAACTRPSRSRPDAPRLTRHVQLTVAEPRNRQSLPAPSTSDAVARMGDTDPHIVIPSLPLERRYLSPPRANQRLLRQTTIWRRATRVVATATPCCRRTRPSAPTAARCARGGRPRPARGSSTVAQRQSAACA